MEYHVSATKTNVLPTMMVVPGEANNKIKISSKILFEYSGN